MSKHMFYLGDRSFSGQFGKITGAGDLKIEESEVGKLRNAGDVQVIRSRIESIRSAGSFHAISSQFGHVRLVGDAKTDGICTADIFSIIGHIQAELLQARILKCNKPGKRIKVSGLTSQVMWQGQFEAETFEVLFDFKLQCDYVFKSILNSASLISDEEIMCDQLYNFGSIQAPAVNAEKIFMLTYADNDVQSLTGSEIVVSHRFSPNEAFRFVPKTETYSNCQSDQQILSLRTIEGDKIQIDHTKADLISGKDVVIGDLCVIDRVEYQDSISLSDKAIVSEVVKL